MPAADPQAVINNSNTGSRLSGGHGNDTVQDGVRNMAHHQRLHKGSANVAQSRTDQMLSSLVSNPALTFQTAGQSRLRPKPPRPMLLLLGDGCLSFLLLLLRCWPEPSLAPASLLSSPNASVASTSAASLTTPAFLASLVASRPTIHCLMSRSDLSSPLMSEARSKAHERGAILRMTETMDPLNLSTSLPPALRFDRVVCSIQLENSDSRAVVDMMIPALISIAEVMNENGALRLVLGTGYSELHCLQELIDRASLTAGLRFERKEDLVLSNAATIREEGAVNMMAAPDGFRDGALFVFVRRPMSERDREQPRVDGRVRSGREDERAWEAMRHRQREEQRRRALQRLPVTPSRQSERQWGLDASIAVRDY